jgi:hypothetical protein
MIRLFQQKGMQAFDRYLIAKRSSEASSPPTLVDSPEATAAKLKVESDTWMKAAELLRKEEAGK